MRRFPGPSKGVFTQAPAGRARPGASKMDSNGFELVEERRKTDRDPIARGQRERERAINTARDREEQPFGWRRGDRGDHAEKTAPQRVNDATPAWMRDDAAPQRATPAQRVDSIQEFRAMMREKERAAHGEKEPVGAEPAGGAAAPVEEPAGMSRSSRFAHFFDGREKGEEKGEAAKSGTAAPATDSLDLFKLFQSASVGEKQGTPPAPAPRKPSNATTTATRQVSSPAPASAPASAPQASPAVPSPVPQAVRPMAPATPPIPGQPQPSAADYASMQKIMALLQGGPKRSASGTSSAPAPVSQREGERSGSATPQSVPHPPGLPRHGTPASDGRGTPQDQAAFFNGLLKQHRPPVATQQGLTNASPYAGAPPAHFAPHAQPTVPLGPPPGLVRGPPQGPWPNAAMQPPRSGNAPSPGPYGPPPGLGARPPMMYGNMRDMRPPPGL